MLFIIFNFAFFFFFFVPSHRFWSAVSEHSARVPTFVILENTCLSLCVSLCAVLRFSLCGLWEKTWALLEISVHSESGHLQKWNQTKPVNWWLKLALPHFQRHNGFIRRAEWNLLCWEQPDQLQGASDESKLLYKYSWSFLLLFKQLTFYVNH